MSERVDHVAEAKGLMRSGGALSNIPQDPRYIPAAIAHLLAALVEATDRQTAAIEAQTLAECRHYRGLNCGQCVPEVMKP